MPRYRLDFSYKAKIHYEIYINEDCSLEREDYLMEHIKLAIKDTAWQLECDSSDGEWIGIIIHCINNSYNIEEYELSSECDGTEVNLSGMIQFITPTKMNYDSDITDRLVKTMDIHFEHIGYDIDESAIYEACRYLQKSFWISTEIDDLTVEAKAILKEID